MISVAGGLFAVVVGVVLYAYYDFTHNFRPLLTTQQISDAQIALKGAMGEAMFSEQQLKADVVLAEQLRDKGGLDALFASAPAGNKGQGLIAAYRKDPQKFQGYADMFDTAMNAKQVGGLVLRQGGSHPPRTSEPLQMDAKLKVDAWGNPFCIIPIAATVAVVNSSATYTAQGSQNSPSILGSSAISMWHESPSPPRYRTTRQVTFLESRYFSTSALSIPTRKSR